MDENYQSEWTKSIPLKEQKKIIKDLADKLPSMTERERGYLEGTIATAAAMSKKDKEGEKNERNDSD